DTGWHIVLLVDDLLAINLQERDLVDDRFDGQRLGAVGRDRDMRDAVAHCDRVGDLYVLARDGEDTNRVIGAVRNERKVTFFANVESGWLLANPRPCQSAWEGSPSGRRCRLCCPAPVSSSRHP